jgi:hypothetical protein
MLSLIQVCSGRSWCTIVGGNNYAPGLLCKQFIYQVHVSKVTVLGIIYILILNDGTSTF